MNQLSKILSPACVVLDDPARDKSACLGRLAALFAPGCGIDPARILAALKAREALGSTALGQGVAIPHGRLRGISRPAAAFLRLQQGVDFDAPDGQPVRILLALIVPESATEQHLLVLSDLAQILGHRGTREALLAEADAGAVHARIVGWDPVAAQGSAARHA